MLSQQLLREHFLYLHIASVDARSRGKRGCDSSEHRDKDIQDFTPKRFIFHHLH